MRSPTESEIFLFKLRHGENIHWLGHPIKEAYAGLLARKIDIFFGVPAFAVVLSNLFDGQFRGTALALNSVILLGSYGLVRLLATKNDDYRTSIGYAVTDHRVVATFMSAQGRYVARSIRFSDIAGIRIKMWDRDIGTVVIQSRSGWWANISFEVIENPSEIESLLKSLRSAENTADRCR